MHKVYSPMVVARLPTTSLSSHLDSTSSFGIQLINVVHKVFSVRYLIVLNVLLLHWSCLLKIARLTIYKDSRLIFHRWVEETRFGYLSHVYRAFTRLRPISKRSHVREALWIRFIVQRPFCVCVKCRSKILNFASWLVIFKIFKLDSLTSLKLRVHPILHLVLLVVAIEDLGDYVLVLTNLYAH